MTANGRAATLRDLHRPGTPLLLPNVWDAPSARLVVSAGAPAVATSSAAIADSLGHADGEATPVADMLAVITRIAAAVDVPVTADLERGYRMRPGELVERLAATGAVGCNLEDSDPHTSVLVDAEEQAAFLADVRDAADRHGVDLVVNARIDTFLRDVPPVVQARRFADTVRRARLYRQAGADCVYPILLADEDAIAHLVREAGTPVNVLATADGPTPATLAGLGVARVSYGSRLYRAALTHLETLIGDAVAGRPLT